MKNIVSFGILFILSFTFLCCQQKQEIIYIIKLKSVIDLDYPIDYTVTWAEESSGSGDYDDSFELTFSENSMNKIIKQIDTLKLGKVVHCPGAFLVHKQIKEKKSLAQSVVVA